MSGKINHVNVSNIHDCYGCGVCSISCPASIIEIRYNEKGFLEPFIVNHDKCKNCGLCIKNCAYNYDHVALNNVPLDAYAGWSTNKHIRFKSSTGGVCFELCKYFINEGYKICGAKYNSDGNIVTHEICTTLDELDQISGSKYLQSHTVKGFSQLNRNDKFVVIGTPCQIDSLRRYIQTNRIEKNYILIDFFCHGVPSRKLWDKFSLKQYKKIGKFTSVTWRNKVDGWHKSYRLDITAENGEYHHTGLKFDDFFNLYFSNAALSSACFDRCKYKQLNSSADIRIGDMWGTIYKSNEHGINSIICFTNKGVNAIQNLDCIIKPHSIDDVISGQMKTLPIRDRFYFKLNPLIVADADNWNKIVRISRWLQLNKRIIGKLRIILKNI